MIAGPEPCVRTMPGIPIQTPEAIQEAHNYVTFYGSSDDLIEVDGSIPGCDEYTGESADFDIAGLIVRVFYNDGGCWSIAVGQIDEDVPVLARVESLVADGYTMKLTLDVPNGSHVTKVA